MRQGTVWPAEPVRNELAGHVWILRTEPERTNQIVTQVRGKKAAMDRQK